ncbi:MAG TPA: serine--tRNA ligase [Candidatus Altiarchaeales archaeon]|nr:serine--tRNA ligase [Candidatus Altiarchaeales archaeon]
MLDITHVRREPKAVLENLEKRQDKKAVEDFKTLLEKDESWRKLKARADSLRKSRNEMTEQVKKVKQEGRDITPLLESAKSLPKEIQKLDDEVEKVRAEVDMLLMRTPNLLHDTVPFGKSAEDNQVVRTFGEPSKPNFELKHHGQLAQDLDLADFERAVKISGAGFYFLKGELALMDHALMNLGLSILLEKGFTPVIPPFMMRRTPYEGVTDLSDFEDVMYKIEGEDEYMIATSEHPIAAMHMGEILEENQLPLKYAGISQCFRKEIGKHGLDERGLFRVHQFSKIEQFVFAKPDDSWNIIEDLIKNAEELMQKLEIPYRIVNVCTGDIGTVAAKKYDLEGWSPREEKFIELASCSNCTSYQAVRLGIKYRHGNDKDYVHTLNSTMIATARVLRLILENYQTEDGGLKIPKALTKQLCCDYIGR